MYLHGYNYNSGIVQSILNFLHWCQVGPQQFITKSHALWDTLFSAA